MKKPRTLEQIQEENRRKNARRGVRNWKREYEIRKLKALARGFSGVTDMEGRLRKDPYA